MLRTKVVQGVLTADQAEVMASITDDFARGIIDCTTRQCFQNHWLTLDEVPEVFSRLEKVGLTTSGACGDITRNVVGCTLAGIGHEQIADGHAVAEAIHQYFLDNKLYSNLPRKYKISVTGCKEDCARGLINDVSLSGAIHEDGTHGFNIRVGGGLSSAPRFSRSIDVFVAPEEAPEVVAGITAIFRDSDENRAKRGKARLKFLVDQIGPDGLREQLVERLGHDVRRAARVAPDLQGPRPHRRDPADRRRALGGRLLRPGRAPARRPAPRARPARPRVRHDARGPAHAPAERAAAVDPQRARGGAAGRAARPGALADARAVHARAADLHRQGVLRAGQGPHQGARGGDRQVPRRPRRQERPRRGLPPALRGLLVELRPAPDRRRRHRGRAQEGRRRVHRGDGHPHRRPARARPALRRRRAQEGPALGARPDAAADLLALRDLATTRARRSATSRAAPSPSGGPSS